MAEHYCVVCNNFRSSSSTEMERHVATIHGNETFSTLRCQECQRKFYDFNHFQDHVQEMPTCFTNCLKITPEPLSPQLEAAFASLVSQMMKPINGQSINQNSMAPIGDIKQEPNGYPAEGTPKIISVKSLAGRTRASKRRLDIERQEFMQKSNGSPKRHQQNGESTSLVMDGLGSLLKRETRKMPDSPKRKILRQPTMPKTRGSAKKVQGGRLGNHKKTKRSLTNLNEHCREIFNKRQRDNRLTCILCKGSLSTSNSSVANARNHARLHLGVLTLKCDICGHKGMTKPTIQMHISSAHPDARPDAFTDSSADHEENLKVWFTKCFDHNVHTSTPVKRNNLIGTAANRFGNGLKAANSRGAIISKKSKKQPQQAKRRRLVNQLVKQELEDPHQNGKQISVKSGNRLAKSPLRKSTAPKNHSAKGANITSGKWKLAHARFLSQKRECWNMVKKFVKDGKVQCQKCSTAISASNTNAVYRHAATHIDLRPFECSNCHFLSRTDVSMHCHTRTCQKGGDRKYIDHSGKYRQEICDNFLACFELKGGNEASTSGMQSQNAIGAIEVKVEVGSDTSNNGLSTKNWLHCDQCIFKSVIPKLLEMHRTTMHKAVD